MEVTIHLTRRDLFLMYLCLFPRLKGNWIFFFLLWIGLVVFHVVTRGAPQTAAQATTLIFSCGVESVIAATAVFLWGVIWMTVFSGAANSVLGTHRYTLGDDGLREKIRANEILTPWSDIVSVGAVGPYLLVRVNRRLFHAISMASFSTAEEYHRFRDALIAGWKTQVQSRSTPPRPRSRTG
jgi:YcxB-like protein